MTRYTLSMPSLKKLNGSSTVQRLQNLFMQVSFAKGFSPMLSAVDEVEPGKFVAAVVVESHNSTHSRWQFSFTIAVHPSRCGDSACYTSSVDSEHFAIDTHEMEMLFGCDIITDPRAYVQPERSGLKVLSGDMIH